MKLIIKSYETFLEKVEDLYLEMLATQALAEENELIPHEAVKKSIKKSSGIFIKSLKTHKIVNLFEDISLANSIQTYAAISRIISPLKHHPVRPPSGCRSLLRYRL